MARLGRSFPQKPIIKSPFFAYNVPVYIVLAQQSWQWVGQQIIADDKTLIVLTQQTWQWTTQTLTVNMKTMLTLVTQTWLWQAFAMLLPNSTTYTRLLLLLGVGQ